MMELDQIIALVDERLNESEDALVSAFNQDVEDLDVTLLFNQPENATNRLDVDLAARERNPILKSLRRLIDLPRP